MGIKSSSKLTYFKISISSNYQFNQLSQKKQQQTNNNWVDNQVKTQ